MGDPTATSAATNLTNPSTAYVVADCVNPVNYLDILEGTQYLPNQGLNATGLSTTVTATGSSSSYTSLDGAIIAPAASTQTILFPNVLPPCFALGSSTTAVPPASGVAVQLGTGAFITPTYAGIAPGGVMGLYQIDVAIPTSYKYVPTPTPAVAPATGMSMPLTIYVNASQARLE